jgi:FlaA1/EpsC-like NDP-sugar epimerase
LACTGAFVETMLGLADRERPVGHRVVPTYTGHLAADHAPADETTACTMASEAVAVVRLAVEIFHQAGIDCRVLSMTSDVEKQRRAAVLTCYQRARAPVLLADCRRASPTIWRARAGAGGPRMVVTGGAGSRTNFARRAGAPSEDEVVVLDSSRSGQRKPARTARRRPRARAQRHRRREAVRRLEGCDAIVNFAAETHVDRSIEAPGEFIETDVFGTFILLEAARDAGVRHLQISTDEVYGSIEEGSFD